LKKEDVKVWIGFVYLRTGPVASSWEHNNKPSCSATSGVPSNQAATSFLKGAMFCGDTSRNFLYEKKRKDQ
jgi:hypothetical protein